MDEIQRKRSRCSANEGPYVGQQKQKKKSLPKIQSRAMPKVLVEAIGHLNTNQRDAVVEMGFGSILELKIEQVPTELAYWLVENFDPVSSELILPKGKSIHIDSEDVKRVLGLPDGHKLVETKKKSEVCNLLVTWQNFFNKNEFSITANDVSVKMLECKDGGEWFKRHFIVLIDCLIIGNNQSGYANPLVMKCLDDVQNIPSLSWCDYTMKTLIRNRARWEKSNKTQFNGPIVFLAALYMDRVIIYSRDVPRRLPSILGWTGVIMKTRTAKEINLGGFGRGFVDDPLQVEVTTNDISVPITGNYKSSTKFDTSPLDVGIQDYASKVLSKLSCLANDVLDIISLIQRAPREVLENDQFDRIHKVAKNLICFTSNEAKPSFPSPNPEVSYTQENEAFWKNPETIAAIDKIFDALSKRNEFTMNNDEFPSFSLGFTQDEAWSPVIQRFSVGGHEPIEHNIPSIREKGVINKRVPGIFDREDSDADESFENIHPQTLHIQKSKRDQRKGNWVISPYITRQVTLASKCNKQQTMIVKWLIENEGGDKNEVIFKFRHNSLLRAEIETLRNGEFVSVAVVDTWTRILNHKEQYRSKSSPFRYFSSTYPCQYTVISPKEDWDFKTKLHTFATSFEAEFNDMPGLNLQAIDMFFFPIFKSAHFIVVCFDIKRRKCHILDNSDEGGTNLIKYERMPQNLRHIFSQYVQSKGYDCLSTIIESTVPARLAMSWRDNENKVDCAIFAMRHMETYMGGGAKGWESGLFKQNNMQISLLRAKYCACIALDEVNEVKDKNLEESKRFRSEKTKFVEAN